MDRLSQLKVRGLVVGPIHVAPPDDARGLRFEEIPTESGNLEQFKGVIQAAHRKGEDPFLCLHMKVTTQQEPAGVLYIYTTYTLYCYTVSRLLHKHVVPGLFLVLDSVFVSAT